MQKTNLMALALASVFSVAANAADPVTPVATGATLTKNEKIAELPQPTKKTTIGSLSEKTLQLYELELDAKISDVQKKINGVSSSDSKARLPDVSMHIPAPIPMSISQPQTPDFIATAIFGKTNDLKAEVIANGKPFLVKRGGTNIPGWTVTNITTERVTLSNGKKTKEVFLSTQSTGVSMPVLPNMMPGLPTGVN